MEEVAQEVAPDASEVDAPDAPEVDAPEMPELPVDAPGVLEVAEPAAPVKRPRGRPRKNPEEPKRPRGRPRKEKEVRFEEPEAMPEAVPEPSPIPDAMYLLAQVLLQNEAEARRRKAARYKNMLGL